MSELGYASSVRKLCLMIMEGIIKLFLVRLAYAESETELSADSCITAGETGIFKASDNTSGRKNRKTEESIQNQDLKRYVQAIATIGGWKGNESKRHPGITTLWIELKYFKAAMQG